MAISAARPVTKNPAARVDVLAAMIKFLRAFNGRFPAW